VQILYCNKFRKKNLSIKYEAILAKVPDIEPEDYDKLPQ
jgi:hypothetical protein